MYQIKNVINYDREALERELENDAERFYNDKRLRRLMWRGTWIRFGRLAVLTLGLACSLAGLILVIIGKHIEISRVLSFLGVILCGLSTFVLSSVVSRSLSKIKKQVKEILDTYETTNALKYHAFVSSSDKATVEVWGYELKDLKYEVTLSKRVDGQLKKETLICEYDDRNPSGVLTLDVQNGVVLHM